MGFRSHIAGLFVQLFWPEQGHAPPRLRLTNKYMGLWESWFLPVRSPSPFPPFGFQCICVASGFAPVAMILMNDGGLRRPMDPSRSRSNGV